MQLTSGLTSPDKGRLATEHYIYSMKNMKTTEIKNIIQNELPLILGRLSDETIDNILVERDDNFFSEQWMQAYNEVEKQKNNKEYLLHIMKI